MRRMRNNEKEQNPEWIIYDILLMVLPNLPLISLL